MTPGGHRDAEVRGAAVMSVGTMLSRGTGLLRVSVTLAALGLSTVSDAYMAANTTPNMIYELVLGGILTSVFVPILVQRMAAGDWRETTSRFLTLTLVTLAAVTVAGMLAAPWIMRLYLSGVQDPAQREAQIALGTTFLRWFMPQIVFYGLGAVAGGVLTAHRRFGPPMFAPILNNVAVIITMGVFIAWGTGDLDAATLGTRETTLLGLGTTLGVVAMTVALWPALGSLGFRWRWRLTLRDDAVRSLLRLGRWVVVYVAANQLAYFVIITMNGRLREGAYTAYAQAFVFFSLPHAIVAVSIATAILPRMAERWAAADAEGVAGACSRGLRDTEVAMLPAAIGLAVMAGPIVALLAGYGAIGVDDQELLAHTLAAFAIGLPFFSAFQLLTRTAYATSDSRTPALINIGAAIVNLVAAWAFAFALGLGVPGMALGHATSYLVGSIALFLAVRNRIGDLHARRIASTMGRALAAAVCSGTAALAVTWLIAEVLPVERPLLRAVQVGAGVVAGVLVFAASALMFGVSEVDDVRKALTSRFQR